MFHKKYDQNSVKIPSPRLRILIATIIALAISKHEKTTDHYYKQNITMRILKDFLLVHIYIAKYNFELRAKDTLVQKIVPSTPHNK